MMATDSLLLNSVAYNDIIDAQCVLNQHSQLLTSGCNIERDQEKIISAMGGIDTILQHYLQNRLLDSIQLRSIHSILKENKSKTSSLQDLPIYGTITLDTKNTFLHQIFNYQTAENIINFVYHRYVATFLFICIAYHSISVGIEYIHDRSSWFRSPGYQYPVFCIDTMAISYFILVILSVNRKAFKFSIKSFEFWLKLYYAVGLLISSYLYIIYEKHMTGKELLLHGARYVQVITVIIVYSLMDGINISSWIKAALGVAFAVYISVFAIYYTFLESAGYELELFGSSISLVDFIASSNRVLSIFL